METTVAYSALGVRPETPLAAVRAAYRDRLRRHHPDTGDGDLAALALARNAYRRIAAEAPAAPPPAAAPDRRATLVDVYA
jgi:curved DNA-binding protein CbpA